MEQAGKRRVSRSAGAGRSVTIKDLAAELGLYPDALKLLAGEKVRLENGTTVFTA